MREGLTLTLARQISTWYCVIAEEEKLLRCKISTDTVFNTHKTHAKYVHCVHNRPKLKDVERFRNWSVREPYKRPLCKKTFVSEPFIEKYAISTELSNVNRAKHKCKFHRVCRRDRELSRIAIRRFKSLRNKGREVRELVYGFTPVSHGVTWTRGNFKFDSLYRTCVFMLSLHFMCFNICTYATDLHLKVFTERYGDKNCLDFMQIKQFIERIFMFMYMC